MSWQPIDFQGIVSLDTPVINLLHQYLDEQESLLARSILESIPPSLHTPVLSYGGMLRLSDAIETFGKRCAQSPEKLSSDLSDNDWKIPAKYINKALWKYVEVLEGCVTELFQQLDLIGLEQWHSRLPHVVGTIEDLLLHKIEELKWSIIRLEDQLWRYRLSIESLSGRWVFWTKATRLWTSLLDKELLTNLNKSQAFLKMQYSRFLKRYGVYVNLQEEVESNMDKFEAYLVLPTLELETQRLFKKMYQLLKLWEMNRSAKAVPARELILALHHALSIEKATSIFKEYYAGLRALLFALSRTLKVQGPSLIDNGPARTAIQFETANAQAEIHMIGATVAHYRDFLLRADPDPYVRSRLGFSEWVVGPEPAQTKPLLELGYDIENLSELCDQISKALNIEERKEQISIQQVDREIQQSLHEMSHPLATRRQMRVQIEKVLESLQKLDEWGSFSWQTVDYVGVILSKLLRLDWKYQVLFEFIPFNKIYNVHQSLVRPVEDRAHTNRMQKFTKLLQQIQEWVNKHRTQSHFHDIELDMNDIKVYLQDFLAYIQRVIQDPNLTPDKIHSLKEDISKQLLDYRYLFSNFFYQLRQNESEGQLIRRQFLFVDQYFETVELKLQELQNREIAPPPAPEHPVDEE